MKKFNLVATLIFCLIIAGCTEKKQTEEPPELVELLDELKVSYQIEKTDIEKFQNHLDQLRETKSNINSGQFIQFLTELHSVQALSETDRQKLQRATAYLLDNIDILPILNGQSGVIDDQFSALFLDGVTGHYALSSACSTVHGRNPPLTKTEWYAWSCPATNGRACIFNDPRTYELTACID